MLPVDQGGQVEAVEIGRQSPERIERSIAAATIDQPDVAMSGDGLAAELERCVERERPSR